MVNEYTEHPMVSNRRRPWIPETPEALQEHCRSFSGLEFKVSLRCDQYMFVSLETSEYHFFNNVAVH
ncbi:hypothetical protein SFRURICE_005919 [Spodoptera frugiperda]|nr:hypothetical protein SFRURICE_005919 [Spodoptera frugiperda]